MLHILHQLPGATHPLTWGLLGCSRREIVICLRVLVQKLGKLLTWIHYRKESILLLTPLPLLQAREILRALQNFSVIKALRCAWLFRAARIQLHIFVTISSQTWAKYFTLFRASQSCFHVLLDDLHLFLLYPRTTHLHRRWPGLCALPST